MAYHQIIFGALLILLLLGMASVFAWKQGRVLRSVQVEDLPPDERRFMRSQAWRRLFGSGLMGLLAVLMTAHFYLEEPAGQLVREGEEHAAHGERVPPTPEQQRFVDSYRLFWGGFLLVLLALICLAAVDAFATRRFGFMQYRKIQEERKAMIENELGRIRSQKNGPG